MHYHEYDKRQHFAYSFVIMLAVGLWLNVWPSVFCVLLIGLAKEVWDHFWGSGFCWIDMIANLLGILAAVPIVLAGGLFQ